MKRHLFRFTLFLSICLSIRLTATAQTVDIPDPILRDYIERVLGKAAGAPITVTEMATLTSITIYEQERGVSDLTGLDHAINLMELHLYDSHSISDISPITGLTNLTSLGLGHNQISDISPIAGLTNLTSLGLAGNRISDISSVAGLTNLTELDLGGNSISDISPLAGLTNLTELDLGDNFISDISFVAGLTNLTRLRLDNNFILDISVLAGLINLESLDLGYNLMFDLSPLVANTGLGDGDRVNVGGNHPNFPDNHPDIAVLRERGVRVANQLVFEKGSPNYPDPFRLETWIPYQLREDAFVTLTIYDRSGCIVRTLDVGHQIAGIYTSRFKAAYWDGRNELGERVASGIYFYHLSAGRFSITGRMVILR